MTPQTCATCLFCIVAHDKAQRCNNPEAMRYRQRVASTMTCRDYASDQEATR